MEPKQSKENALFEWYDSLVFALAVIVLFFVFAVRIITVSGVSMQPTLYGGDRVAVQSMLYTPQRGDVVVVDGYINYGDPLVKRIIALGGDTVDIDFETGAVTLNGAVLEEPYISAPTTTGYDVEFPVTVPEGCVFVMGDNRPRSLDGRSTEVGFIDERDILGKVLLRVFPLSSFGKIASERTPHPVVSGAYDKNAASDGKGYPQCGRCAPAFGRTHPAQQPEPGDCAHHGGQAPPVCTE